MIDIKFADWTIPEIAFENNKLNESYFKTGEYVNKPEYYKLKEAFNYVLENENKRPLKVLDIGCGTGWHAVYLKKENLLENIYYDGVDISESMCKFAKLNFPEGNFFNDNIIDDSVNSDYDIVMESAVIELVSDWEIGLINILRSSNSWVIAHRLFFTKDYTKTEQVTTYLGLPDVRYHVGIIDLNNILKKEGFIIVKEDVWNKSSYNMGTFVFKRSNSLC